MASVWEGAIWIADVGGFGDDAHTQGEGKPDHVVPGKFYSLEPFIGDRR